MIFKETLQSNRFIFTVDTTPPKGTNIAPNIRRMTSLIGKVDGINVTDMPSARMRMNPLPISLKLKEMGFQPILQMTCRDRNRLSLQADLLATYALGIENLLVLTGDDIGLSDDSNSKAVFDLDSIELLSAAKRLGDGLDLAGNSIMNPPVFCLGAALNPFSNDPEAEKERAEKKVLAGCDFFQTQPIFDVDSCTTFLNEVNRLDVPILAGILLLKSANSAKYLSKNVPGVRIPDKVIEELESASNPVDKSMQISIRNIEQLRSMVKGVHIMSIGLEHEAARIVDHFTPNKDDT
jgi:5,10-methylenetetrahydrofolate reductase